MLRAGELEEGDRATTSGKKGTKAIADDGELLRKGSREVAEDELEDGEVDEDGDVKLASSEVAAGGASNSGVIRPQLPRSTSTTAGAEYREEAEATKNPANEESTEAAGLGRNFIPLTIKQSGVGLCCMLHISLTFRAGHDPILENIKMAYWWAGYYSGLYEGRQQVTRGSTR